MTASYSMWTAKSAVLIMSLIAFVTAFLTGCSSTDEPPNPTGPLEFMNRGSVVVGMRMPENDRHPSLGTLLVTNTDSSREAILGDIRLGGSQHLKIIGAYVVPVVSGELFGGGFLVPPDAEGFPVPSQDTQWAARQEMVGYRVPPGAEANILIVVDTDDLCGGTSRWSELNYTIGSEHHLAVATTGIAVADEQRAGCETKDET